MTGYKGGVGKSVTAVHLATFFSDKGKTVLVDGDPNRTALAWNSRGGLPFTVADERQAMKVVSGSDFVIIDTPARPNSDDQMTSEPEEEVNLCVKVPKSLRRHWAAESKRTGITITSVIIEALTARFGKPE